MLVSSARRWALMHEHRDEDEPGLKALLEKLSPVDLVLAEGWKRSAQRKLEVYRPAVGRPMLVADDPNVIAVATDAGTLAGVTVPILDIDDVEAVADFVAAYALGSGI